MIGQLNPVTSCSSVRTIDLTRIALSLLCTISDEERDVTCNFGKVCRVYTSWD